MPKLTFTQDIDIKPERFLNQCSPAELFEVQRLIQQKIYQDKIDNLFNGSVLTTATDISEAKEQLTLKQVEDALNASVPSAVCSVCRHNLTTNIYQGHPTCLTCTAMIENNY